MSVDTYFENRSIFITGVTGFIGKVLLEKLLRSCGGIKCIYVLIRPTEKQGKLTKSASDRLQEILKSPLFNLLRRECPSVLQKINAIPGDIACDNLGISEKDRQILAKEVSVVFHMAATIKFIEPIPHILRVNVAGTKSVIDLSRSMENLSSIVIASTAYSNQDLYREPIDEVIYPAAFDPISSIPVFSWMDKMGALDSITPKLIGEKINSYVLSKHLMEDMVNREAKKHNLPICIVRPAGVSPIYSDPPGMEGYVDNLAALGGYICGVGHGFSYVTIGDPNYSADVIPVDYVTKIIILAAWETAMTLNEKQTVNDGNTFSDESLDQYCKVYNASIYQFNRISRSYVDKCIAKSLWKTPFSRILRPPTFKLTKSFWWFKLSNFVIIFLPCVFLDFVSLLCGQKPRTVTIFKKIDKACTVVGKNFLRDLKYKGNNVHGLQSKIRALQGGQNGKHAFDLSLDEIVWEDYIDKCALGVRRYINKDDDSTIPKALKRLRRLEIIYNLIWMGSLLFIPVVIVKVGPNRFAGSTLYTGLYLHCHTVFQQFFTHCLGVFRRF